MALKVVGVGMAHEAAHERHGSLEMGKDYFVSLQRSVGAVVEGPWCWKRTLPARRGSMVAP